MVNQISTIDGILYDLPNLIFCIVSAFMLSKWSGVKRHSFVYIVFLCFVPFFLNDVLFSAHYLPDQFKYWNNVKLIREFNFEAIRAKRDIVEYASWMLSLIPLPYVETVRSLGFFNKFLYLVMFYAFCKKNVFTEKSYKFFLFYPSLILYTSLSLRDTLVLLFMSLGLYYVVNGRIVKASLFTLPLYLIKMQNFYIQAIFISIYYFMNVYKQGISKRNSLFIFGAIYGLLILVFPIAIPIINENRTSMFVEDGGKVADVVLIGGLGDFLREGLTSGLYFLVKPLPWETENTLQLVQSVENVFVLCFIVYVINQCAKYDLNRALFWVLYLFTSCSIYGLVVFNYGSAARYRFPFVVIFITFILFDTYRNKYSKRDATQDSHRLKSVVHPRSLRDKRI